MKKPGPPKSEGQKLEEWLKRTAPAFKKTLDPTGYHLRKPRGEDPLVKAINAVGERARRRMLN